MSNVPEGYKQTEVGVIPENWGVRGIGELAHVTTGGRNTQDRVADGAYPFFVRSQTVERINSYSYDGEAVLTAGDGVGTGKVFHYINGKFDVHQRVYRISEFVNGLDGRYFFLIFSNKFLDRIMQMTAKSSVDSVRMDMITKMSIPLPPLSEQRAIAEALADADALIAAQERLIAKKQAVKQGAMQELLTGRRRLEGFEGEWEEVRLGDVAEIIMGQSPLSSNYHSRPIGLPLIQGNADIKARKSIKRIWTTQITKKAVKSDILMTVRAPVGNIGLAVFDCVLGRGMCAIRPRAISPDFVFHKLISVEDAWEATSQGTTFSAANSEQIQSFTVNIPPTLTEQQAIASILSDMDSEIEGLERELGKLRVIKQGMMQELLTGKTRLI